MKFNISNMTVALAAAALGAASCTANYEDINRNPYEVTAEDMERDGYACLLYTSIPCATA